VVNQDKINNRNNNNNNNRKRKSNNRVTGAAGHVSLCHEKCIAPALSSSPIHILFHLTFRTHRKIIQYNGNLHHVCKKSSDIL
jgi:hypothetical protein